MFFRWLRRIALLARVFVILGLIISVLGVYIAADTATRLGMSDDPQLLHYEGTGKLTRIIFLGGASASPTAQSAGILPMLQEQAKSVDVVEYAADKFSAQKIIDLVIQATASDDHVTFVSASLGGLLSYDIIRTLRERGDTRHFGVVLIDSPTNGDDVIGVPSILKGIPLPVGGITNLWLHPPFDRNAPATLDADVDQQKLETLWRSYETWTASCWADQGRYVFSHDPIQKLDGVTWYFVRSEADTFVGPDAHGNWEKTQGPMEGSIVPDSGHISLLNRPSLYGKEIRTGVKLVAAA